MSVARARSRADVRGRGVRLPAPRAPAAPTPTQPPRADRARRAAGHRLPAVDRAPRTPNRCCPSRSARCRRRWPGRSAAPGLNLHVGGAIAALALMFASYAIAVAAADAAVGARGADRRSRRCTRRAARRRRCSRPTCSATRPTRGWARSTASTRISTGRTRSRSIPSSRTSAPSGQHAERLRPAVHGLQLPAGAAVDRRQRVRLQVDRGRRQPRPGRARLECARLRGIDPVRAAALVGLNPLLVIYGVGGGHNDLLMLVADGGRGLRAARSPRARSAARLTMVAIGVKLTAGLLLPFALAAGGPRRGRDRRRDLAARRRRRLRADRRAQLRGVRHRARFHLLATLRQSQSEGDWHSIPGFISTRLGLADRRPHHRRTCSAAAFVDRAPPGWCGACGRGRPTGSTAPAGRRWRC